MLTHGQTRVFWSYGLEPASTKGRVDVGHMIMWATWSWEMITESTPTWCTRITKPYKIKSCDKQDYMWCHVVGHECDLVITSELMVGHVTLCSQAYANSCDSVMCYVMWLNDHKELKSCGKQYDSMIVGVGVCEVMWRVAHYAVGAAAFILGRAVGHIRKHHGERHSKYARQGHSHKIHSVRRGRDKKRKIK